MKHKVPLVKLIAVKLQHYTKIMRPTTPSYVFFIILLKLYNLQFSITSQHSTLIYKTFPLAYNPPSLPLILFIPSLFKTTSCLFVPLANLLLHLLSSLCPSTSLHYIEAAGSFFLPKYNKRR